MDDYTEELLEMNMLSMEGMDSDYFEYSSVESQDDAVDFDHYVQDCEEL
ncbi:MAG: hypothetical protein ACI9Y1_000828 [Lentisphaeria bacterium]|jgi:hypothetical protein